MDEESIAEKAEQVLEVAYSRGEITYFILQNVLCFSYGMAVFICDWMEKEGYIYRTNEYSKRIKFAVL